MGSTTRDARPGVPNALIDALDVMQAARDGAAAWTAATVVARSLGYAGINAADVDRATGMPAWFRGTMPQAWIEHCLETGWFAVDPLVAAGQAGRGVARHLPGRLRRDAAASEAHYTYDHELRAQGWHSLDLTVFSAPLPSMMRGVVLLRDRQGPAPCALDRMAAAAIAAALVAPDAEDGLVAFGREPLTPREVDVLSHLAAGRRNEDIAHRLGIAEVTVRAHLAAARRKLGAATREQAIVEGIRSGQLRL